MTALMLLILLSVVPRQVCCTFAASLHNDRVLMNDLGQHMQAVRYLTEESRNIDDDDDDDKQIVPEKSPLTAGDVSVDAQFSAAQGEENPVPSLGENYPSSGVESAIDESSFNMDESPRSFESNQPSLGGDGTTAQTEQTGSHTLDQQQQNVPNNSAAINTFESKVSDPPPKSPEDDDDDDDDYIANQQKSDTQNPLLGHENTLAMGDASLSELKSGRENEAMIGAGEMTIPVNNSGGMENESNGETVLQRGDGQQAIISTALDRESETVSMNAGEGNNDNTPFGEGYSNTVGSMGDGSGGDSNPSGIVGSSVEASNNIEHFATTSTIAYHRNESDHEEEGTGVEANIQAATEQVIQGEVDQGEVKNNEETIGVGSLENSPPGEGDVSNEIDSATQICQPAASCMECINLAISHLRSNSEPCYWVGQCISAKEAMSMASPPSGPYKCAPDGSAVYTGEGWDAALNAMDASSQAPVGGEPKSAFPEASAPIGNQEFYYDDDEEYDLFEMVKSTVNVILLAAVIAMVLLIRKRVMNRLRDDSSLDTANVVMEEVVNCIVEIGRFVSNCVNGSRGRNSGSNEYRPVATSARSDSFERRTVPLSTAADEEWGWGDEDTSPQLELPGVGVDDAKEEEDLALAIAMSLSESTNGVSATGIGHRSSTPKPAAAVKPKPPSSYHSRMKEQKAPRTAPVRPASTPTNTQPPRSKGDSIEDLLGQLNTSGAPVVNKFGQKPQNAAKKLTPAPKKQDSASDDIFATVGLSSLSSKPSTATAAPRSAPLQSKSLAADTDLDADWGDDDLNDLLDD
eukprot:CCRYP_020974-RA/>CCRYP_020974-RA protein AED:0.33 eAED:0.33 QI:0/-1/0/1/-1/1/1/0/802